MNGWEKMLNWVKGNVASPSEAIAYWKDRIATPSEVVDYWSPKIQEKGVGGILGEAGSSAARDIGDFGAYIVGGEPAFQERIAKRPVGNPPRVASQVALSTLPSGAQAPQGAATVQRPSMAGLTGEDLIFAAQQRAFPVSDFYGTGVPTRVSGVTYGGGSPVANQKQYEQNIANMQRVQDMTYGMSTAGRAEARQDRQAARAAMVQEAKAGGRQGRGESAQSAQDREAASQQKAALDEYNENLKRTTTIQVTTVWRAITSAANDIVKKFGDKITDEQKELISSFNALTKEPTWNMFMGEIAKAKWFSNENPAAKKLFDDYTQAVNTQDPEARLENIQNVYNSVINTMQ